MRKTDELKTPRSCLNRAGSNEMLFVLRAHDIAAPATIRAWIQERIRLGKNSPNDPELVEAEQCAAAMEQDRARGA